LAFFSFLSRLSEKEKQMASQLLECHTLPTKYTIQFTRKLSPAATKEELHMPKNFKVKTFAVALRIS
jgi:hypothetical protein